MKLHGSNSPRNQITVAYRERFKKLLERPELRPVLSISAKGAGRGDGDPARAP